MLQRIVRTATQIFRVYAVRRNLFLTSVMMQDNVASGSTEKDREESRRDDVPAHKGATTECTQTGLDPYPNWRLEEYRRECTDLRDVKHFDAIAVDAENPVIYDRSHFERDTALGAWKRRFKVLNRGSVGTLVDNRFTEVPSVRREVELP